MSQKSSSDSCTNPGSTDSALLAGIRDQNPQAWNRFVAEYSPLVYIWCRQCDLQSADALDVSQLVFQSVNRSIDTFSKSKSGGTLRGWLWTITRNLVRNHLSRTLRGPRARGGSSIQLRLMQEPESVDESSFSSITVSASTHSLFSSIASIRTEFDERTWQCFWLMTVEELTAAEIAAQLGMKPSAVRQAKYRVTRKLRHELESPN